MASCKADWIAASLAAEDSLDDELSAAWITAAKREANRSAWGWKLIS